MKPKARHEQNIMESVLDETLVYDLERHRAHRLNSTAAAILQRCDGQTTVAEMAASLPGLGLPADEGLVRYALTRLKRAHLLQEPVTVGGRSISRREMLSRLTQGGSMALLLPVVNSISAPRADEAASPLCEQEGKACGETRKGGCARVDIPCCAGLKCDPSVKEGEDCICIKA